MPGASIVSFDLNGWGGGGGGKLVHWLAVLLNSCMKGLRK